MNLVSIIVPIYNSEQYINRCLDSLINQTYKNIEIILIDDGSMDSSIEIVNKYIKKDKRIKLYSQKNSGPSVARNKGIELSTGDYLMFCDSDDYVEKTYVEKLVKKLIDLYCDIVACGYKDISKYGVLKLNDFYYGKEYITKDDFINYIFKGVGGTLWGKIFKKSIIVENNIRMNSKIYMCEDMVFVLEYATNCGLYGAINDKLYNYNRLNENSISTKVNLGYYNNLIKVLEEIEKILIKSKFDEMYVENILKLRIQNTATMFLIMQHNKNYDFSNIQKIENIKMILANQYLKRYKDKFVAVDYKDKVIIYLINNNRYKLLNYYSYFLYKLQLFKDKVRAMIKVVR